ncbi:MAG: TonB-dependent receptor [Kangiellaceae bacterium]|nr:TonB-dependent receptor [Kangiellaceae bacterium]|tara:strand:+ start:1425 stop:3533 length:2109 start_codon:yes stop_codon:yes gene_type:complete
MRRQNRISMAIALALSGIANQVAAQDEWEEDIIGIYGEEEIVSIATGFATPIHKAPSVATVITAEDIKKMGALDIDDVLETVPGLHVSRSNNGYQPLYLIRGMYSSFNPQVLLLINGVPISSSFTGNRSQLWGGMPVEALARVEVIRGPGSAIYGADAFAGVVNLVTKSADDIQGSFVGSRIGTFDTTDFWFGHGKTYGDLKASLIFEYHKTDGGDQVIEEDAQTILDGVFGTNASEAPGEVSNFRDNFDLRTELEWKNWLVHAGWQSREMGTGAGIAEALDSGGIQVSDRYNIDVTFSKDITNDFDIEVFGGYFKMTQEFDEGLYIFPAGADIGFGAPFSDGVIGAPELFEEHSRFHVTANYRGMESHTWRVGMGYNKDDIYKTQEHKNFGVDGNGELILPGSPIVDVTDTPAEFLPESDRNNKFIYVQDVWNFANDWEFTAGVRFDDYSDFGDTTNPRLALVWSTTHALTTKLLYGKAFRAPAFAEMRVTNNPVALGNPDLKPEEVETVELAFDYRPMEKLHISASIFHYEWTDGILFVPDEGETTISAQNAREQSGDGIELEFEWQALDALTLRGNYAYQDSENDITGETVPFVPKQQLFLQADWGVTDDISLHYKLNSVMDRERDQGDLREDVDDYVINDAVLRWEPQNSNVSIALIGRNIFDEDAREPTVNSGPAVNIPNDLPLDGRQWLGELRYRF